MELHKFFRRLVSASLLMLIRKMYALEKILIPPLTIGGRWNFCDTHFDETIHPNIVVDEAPIHLEVVSNIEILFVFFSCTSPLQIPHLCWIHILDNATLEDHTRPGTLEDYLHSTIGVKELINSTMIFGEISTSSQYVDLIVDLGKFIKQNFDTFPKNSKIKLAYHCWRILIH